MKSGRFGTRLELVRRVHQFHKTMSIAAIARNVEVSASLVAKILDTPLKDGIEGMKIQDLLRHVADNVDAGRPAGHGLLYKGNPCRECNPDHICYRSSEKYSLAPLTHEVNGHIVPAPLTEPPEMGTPYFVPALLVDDYCRSSRWDCHGQDLKYLDRGLIHLTKEAAQQNTLAMLGISPDTPIWGD